MSFLNNLNGSLIEGLISDVLFSPTEIVTNLIDAFDGNATHYIPQDATQTFSSGTTIATITALGTSSDTFTPRAAGGTSVDYDSTAFGGLGGYTCNATTDGIFCVDAIPDSFQMAMVFQLGATLTNEPILFGFSTSSTGPASLANFSINTTTGYPYYDRNQAGSDQLITSTDLRDGRHVLYVNAKSLSEWDVYIDGVLVLTFDPVDSYGGYNRIFWGGGDMLFAEPIMVNGAHDPNTQAPIQSIIDYYKNKFYIGLVPPVFLDNDFPATLNRSPGSFYIEETEDDLLAYYTGNTIYVSTSGNDTTGDGSQSAPYLTLNKAITESSNLDRISIDSGIYATPTQNINTSVGFVAPNGGVYIGNFNDLTTATIAQNGTLWTVDDIDAGETFVGFIRTDGTKVAGVSGSSQVSSLANAQDRQTKGIMAVYRNATSAEFALGTAESLQDLVDAGHILAWTDAETRAFTIGSGTTTFIGNGITICNWGSDAIVIGQAAAAHIRLGACEVYGGQDSTIEHAGSGTLISIGTTYCGAGQDNVDYRGTVIGVEKNVISHWPGDGTSDNCSTAHSQSSVVRTGGSYRGGSRAVHDIDNTQAYTFSSTIGDTLQGTQVSLQSDGGLFVYGNNTFIDTFSQGTLTDISDGATNSYNVRTYDYWPFNITPISTLATIDGLELWFDGKDSSTVSHTAGAVSQIDDKSGNDNNAVQTVGASRPTYNETTGEINYNGTSSFLQISDTNWFNPSTKLIVFMVFESDISNLTSSLSLFGQYNVSTSDRSWLLGVDANEKFLALFGDGSGNYDSTAVFDNAFAVADKNIIIFEYNAGTVSFYLNGASQAFTTLSGPTTTSLFNTSVDLIIGSTQGTSGFWDGNINEIAAYTEVSNEQKNLIGKYMADKWGVSWRYIA